MTAESSREPSDHAEPVPPSEPPGNTASLSLSISSGPVDLMVAAFKERRYSREQLESFLGDAMRQQRREGISRERVIGELRDVLDRHVPVRKRGTPGTGQRQKDVFVAELIGWCADECDRQDGRPTAR